MIDNLFCSFHKQIRLIDMLIVHWSENTAFPLGKKLVESLYMETKCSNKFRHFDFVFLLLARESWSKLRAPIARSPVLAMAEYSSKLELCSFGLTKTLKN